MPDALARLLRALSQVPLPAGADAGTLADAVWLAASGVVGEGGALPATVDAGETAPDPAPDEVAGADGDATAGVGATDAPGRGSTELSLRQFGSGTKVRGVPLSLGRADPLPDALAVGRAIQPFRRQWRRGGRSRLDIEATVEHYARGGPLVPLFRPAPEPWFEAVVLVDSSLSMSVWEETSRAVIRLLTSLGGFRAVHTWRLEWPGNEPRVLDHHGREVSGTRVPHHGSGTQGRRLVLVVSDCAARGWHTPEPWLLLREWGEQVPVALLDPLPPRLWRRSALNLTAVNVTGGRAGGHNGSLRFTVPPRLRPRADGEGDRAAGSWSALPVVSCTPHSLGAWANTLMRGDPTGCGAVLVPATGRLPQGRTGPAPARQPDPALLAEAFTRTAPAPAVRLAVLCSGLLELPLPLLHVLRDQTVPTATYADLAEVLTSGLFAVRRDPGGDPVLALHPAARTYLRTHLTTHDLWQTRAAFSRHAATHPYAPQGIAAVLHDAWATDELPVTEEPLADTAAAPARPAGRGRTSAPPIPGEGRAGGAAGPDGEASIVAGDIEGALRSVKGGPSSGTLRDARILLRHLIAYTRSALPSPLGGWPGRDTRFDGLRTAGDRLKPADVVSDLSRYSSTEGVELTRRPPEEDPTGHGLVWHAPDGPLHVTVEDAPGRGAPASSLVEFRMFIDESDKPDGLAPLDRCVRVAEREAPAGVAVVLRLQTLYGAAPPGSPAALAAALRTLHSRAGSPTHSQMIALAARESPPVSLRSTTLYEWFTGRSVPADEKAFDWLTHHLAERAEPEGDSGPTLFRLAALRHHAAAARKQRGSGPPGLRSRLGRPIAELVQEAARLGLVPYHLRAGDLRLRDVVRDCAAGASAMALLVGPPGSGKSRASVEAARLLPDDWWLWEPASGAELEAALDAPSTVGPRTVVWLDNADRYLLDRSDDGRGERIASGLRALLRRAHRGPVLVLGSLRTEEMNVLTNIPGVGDDDPHAQARALCEENLVLDMQPTADSAVGRIPSGTGVDRAVVDAAIDARRCGHGPLMSGTLLAQGAVDYLGTGSAPSIPGDVSFEALLGLGLSLVPPPTDDAGASRPYFQLADDVMQHGRELRLHLAPPESLWNALAEHAATPDLEAIARAAHERGDTEHAERFRALVDFAQGGRAASTTHANAAPALRNLLRRTDLTPAQARAAADEALAWLRADGGTESSQYVLNGLLPRTGLSRAQTAEAVQHALGWLSVHGGIQAGAFVVAPLLAVIGLNESEGRQVLDYALRWLDVHGGSLPAQFVLRPLLRHRELSEGQAHSVAERALNWLDLHGGLRTDQFVLSAALRRKDLAPELLARFVALGIDWLRTVGTDASAKFVLRPLLQHSDLTPTQARETAALAMRWLRGHGTTRDAQFVFNALLYREDLAQDEVREAGEMALDWLRAHSGHSSARYVLRPLLERSDLGRALATLAVGAGTEWSRARLDSGKPDWGVQQLLGQHDDATGHVRTGVLLAVEIADFSGAGTAVQADRQRALYTVLDTVLTEVSEMRCERRSTGDGEMLLFFPRESRRAELVRELLRHLERAAHNHAVTGGLRLRVALHLAELGGDIVELGRDEVWHGRAFVTAARLVDSDALRTALAVGGRSPVAAAVSEELFTLAFPEGEPLADTFRPIRITTKEDVLRAWISVSGFEEPPGIEAWTRRARG
ncbi:SAV_2336 N-terminal domain-related protein [Streptomyces drozdowiczii]